jgi:hypothetical protein
MISSTSRYATVETATYRTADGRTLPYLRRRFAPPPESLASMADITVTAESRLDLIAAKLQGDPLRFWRIADANAAMNPLELTRRPGERLRVPKPGF